MNKRATAGIFPDPRVSRADARGPEDDEACEG